MQRPPLEVADLVRAGGQGVLVHSRKWLRGQHRKVLSAIARCRTAALGGHRLRCDGCDHDYHVQWDDIVIPITSQMGIDTSDVPMSNAFCQKIIDWNF